MYEVDVIDVNDVKYSYTANAVFVKDGLMIFTDAGIFVFEQEEIKCLTIYKGDDCNGKTEIL